MRSPERILSERILPERILSEKEQTFEKYIDICYESIYNKRTNVHAIRKGVQYGSKRHEGERVSLEQ